MLKVDRKSAIVGSAITAGVLTLGLLVASAAQAFSWPWQHTNKPEVTRVVTGTLVCANFATSFGGSAASLTTMVDGVTETVSYPAKVSDRVRIFTQPSYAHYRQEVRIPQDKDTARLDYDLKCRTPAGEVITGNTGNFNVDREDGNRDLHRTICIDGLKPCNGPEWNERLGCTAVLLVAGPGGVAALDALETAVRNEPNSAQLYNDLKAATTRDGVRRKLGGALACFQRSTAAEVLVGPTSEPVPTVPPNRTQPVPAVTPDPGVPAPPQPDPPVGPPPPPSQVNRTAIVSYDQMRGGAPYWGRSNLGYQAFTVRSNTLTVVGVTWNNNNYTHGQVLDGIATRISVCTGVSNATCTGRIADGYATVHNTGDTRIDFGDVAVTPGVTYYLFYYQPSVGAGSWDLYWWNCPACNGAGRQPAQYSDQNQAIVLGYNR